MGGSSTSKCELGLGDIRNNHDRFAAALVGFLGYGLSLVLFVLALREVGAARTGAYFSTAPFIGSVVGLVALGERVSAALLAAAVLMGVGVYLHLTEHRREAKR